MSEIKRNNKVLVAMNGRVSSTVAAYLLKKQGLEPIGIGIEMFYHDEDGFEFDVNNFPGITNQAFERMKLSNPLRCHYYIPDIEEVKAIADRLEIPFYGVSAQENYYDEIQDRLVASRLSGRVFAPSFYVTQMIIRILQEKAKKLGADWVATGHFAKVLHSSDGKKSSVYTSNDFSEDQSFQFSLLKQNELNNLLLPLSEMRFSETLKIAKLIGIEEQNLDKEMDADKEYIYDPRVPILVNKFSPFSLREEGDIYHYFNDIILGDHDGIAFFHPGKEKLSTRMTPIMDNTLSVIKILPGFKRVLVADRTKLKFTHVICRNFNISSDLDCSKPVSSYIKLFNEEEKLNCTIYFKTNDYLVVRFASAQIGALYQGAAVSFYSKKGIGGKLLGGAEVFQSVEFYNDNYRELPPRDPELDEIQLEKEAKNANPYETKYSDPRHHF